LRRTFFDDKKAGMTVRPYGTWPSEVDADLVAGGAGRSFGATDLSDGRLRWTEGRTFEDGRIVVVEARPDGEPVDVTPPGTNARTRVHEYGGGAVWFHGDTTYFSEFEDSRLYRVDGAGGEMRPITPEPPEPHALRYADGRVTPDGSMIFCVRERHDGEDVHNELVVLPADGSADPRIVAGGHDFFMAPRLDPAGRRLAWFSWDHPRMPWDGTELWVADVAADGTLDGARLVAGGTEESVIDPRWSPGGVLHYSSDRTGWWNIYSEDGAALTSLGDAEIGFPAWIFGTSSYVFLDDGRIACIVTRSASESLQLLEPGRPELKPAGLEWSSFGPASLSAGGGRVVFSAASPTRPTALVSYEPGSGRETIVRRSIDVELDPASISVPRAIEFPTGDGAPAHAFYYPPANGGYEGPADELPPLQVICHGGPTAHTTPYLELEVQFFTQRGIGVVDVNYRGSTGYGRAFRQLLNGRWGEIDWQDCVAAARYLAEQGEVDPDRTWVEGGSAGGYVVLCALVFDPPAFSAGVSYFGVADAEALALDTHKFESRYLDSMIGPYPERADLYRARSPVHFVEQLERPLLLLQGLDDKVVPPSQAEAMVEVLERKGIPYAYLAFEGEGHGFRRQENIKRSLEATLSFVGQVFGFVAADELESLAIAHL
jgi:dipeptidyl aminopeptidase/acylaminoacyl peptidase